MQRPDWGQVPEGAGLQRRDAAAVALTVHLNVFMLLLDDLPHLLLQLRGDDELVVGVRLGGGTEVPPLFPGRGVACLLDEVLAPSLARHGAVGPSPAAQTP